MQGLIGDTSFLYLDDLLIPSKNIADHERKLKLVFQCLANTNLTINVKKCQFFRKQTEYLGHTVDSAGLRPNNKKVWDVQNFLVHSTITQVKSFLGLAGFYNPFIEKFETVAKPLTRLLKIDVPFTWTGEQQQAYEALKQCLTEAPVLSFPDFNETFYLATDASSIGLGAAPMQSHQAESNYSVTELEALAVVWSHKHFLEIILGYNFHVPTERTRNVLVNHLSVLSPLELQAKQCPNRLYADIIAHLEDTTKPRPTNRYLPIEEFYLRDSLLFRKSAPKKLRGFKQRRM